MKRDNHKGFLKGFFVFFVSCGYNTIFYTRYMAKRQALPKYLTTVTPFSKYLALALFVILPILTGYVAMKYQKTLDTISMRPRSLTPWTINLQAGSSDLPYFTAELKVPAGYYATDDDMLTAYDSQGGMAPPRLILMRNDQVHSDSFMEAIQKPDDDCVVVWSTQDFDDVNDWTELIGLTGLLTEQQFVPTNERKAVTYRMTKTDREIYVGFLPVNNADNTTYFFHTCNTENKKDFVSVIQSLKFRDDLRL